MNAAAYDLYTLVAIREHAVTLPGIVPGADGWTFAGWLRGRAWNGTRVIAQQGDPAGRAPGWALFWQDDALHVRLTFDSGETITLCAPFTDTERWHCLAWVIDPAAGEARLLLDGRRADRALLPAHARLTPPPEIVFGGYTDAAGGHFDHTFGRDRTGLLDAVRIATQTSPDDAIAAMTAVDSPPPHIEMQIDPAPSDAPCRVTFRAVVDGAARGCLWTFDDGIEADGAVVTRDFRYGGAIAITLTVIDAAYREHMLTRTLSLGGTPNPLERVPVFVNGAEGYACYRIPSIVRALNDDLIAFAEARRGSCSDSTPIIHLVCKRSSDNGRSWGPAQVVAQNVQPDGEYAVQNAAPVVDAVHGTGRIVVVYRKTEHSEWDIVRGQGVNRAFRIVSDDHGQTWGDERDITRCVHHPYNPVYRDAYPDAALDENRAHDWRIQIPCQGHAIQLQRTHAGRLFFAGSITQGDRGIFESQNYAFWSDDNGETWQIGGVIPHIGLNEAIAVELEDGAILFNTRAYRDSVPTGRRAITIGRFTPDGGMAFEATYLDDALIDPAVQASLLRYTWRDQAAYGGRSRLLFVNPAHPRARRHLTVRLSEDEGRTWRYSRTLDPQAASYSDLVAQADMRIGVLYERGNQGGIWYVNFTLDWLTDGADRLEGQA